MADMDERELLALVGDEMRRAIGFDEDTTLSDARNRALLYYRGEMPDMPPQLNRSRAVSSDVRDAIETALPDLIEILSNEAVVEFPPTGPDDEEQAELETDYVRNVFFEDNRGFWTLYCSIKDALMMRTGVIKVWPEREEYEEEQALEGQPLGSAQMAQAAGLTVDDYQSDGVTEAFAVKRTVGVGRVRVAPWPAEDIAFARDATSVEDAPYFAARERVRAFELLERGYPADEVSKLQAYGGGDDESIRNNRNLAEDDGINDLGGIGDHRLVEVVEHYIRVRKKGGGLCIKRVVTDSDASVVLDYEEVDAIPFAVGTPYMIPHRIMGLSVADLLMEVQQIKTALLRMALDSGYFALNQRHEVAVDQSTDDTIRDLVQNAPGMPVRSRTGSAVRPLPSPGLSFDAWGALEAVTAMGENRTGIIRAAQGLNSDALHDTATGMKELAGAAQKRLRLIARVLGECMVAPAFRLVHAACRVAIQEPVPKKVMGSWRDNVVPSEWRGRGDIKVDVGIGSGGRQEDILYSTRILELQREMVAGGLGGVMIRPEHIHAAFTRLLRAMGVKNVDAMVADPAEAQAQPEAEPKPDPALLEAQAKAQAKRLEAQLDAELAREKLAVETELAREKMQAEMQLARERMRLEAELGLVKEASNLPESRPGGSLAS